MNQEAENNVSNITEKISTQFAADKKKSIIAVGLLLIMAIMWMKMLTGKTPDNAKAALKTDHEIKKEETRINYKNLPCITGRHDTLTRDMFAAENFNEYINNDQENSNEEIKRVGTDISKGSIQRLAQMLKLEAIGHSSNPEAFINNRLYSAEDVITVNDGSSTYQCRVVKISENAVTLKYEDSEIELKLKQTTATSVD